MMPTVKIAARTFIKSARDRTQQQNQAIYVARVKVNQIWKTEGQKIREDAKQCTITGAKEGDRVQGLASTIDNIVEKRGWCSGRGYPPGYMGSDRKSGIVSKSGKFLKKEEVLYDAAC